MVLFLKKKIFNLFFENFVCTLLNTPTPMADCRFLSLISVGQVECPLLGL